MAGVVGADGVHQQALRAGRTRPHAIATSSQTESRSSNAEARLPRLSRHHAGRSARPRGDAAVLHRGLRQSREPPARVSAGTPTRRSTAPAGEVASLIGATAGEIVFTSGATESNNLAIKGAAHACRERGNHIVTVATEHKSVLDSFKRLEREGWRVTRLGVDARRLHPARRAARGDDRPDRARVGDGRQQRDWRRCSRSPRSAPSPAPRARCSTPTPRRRRARCRSTSTRWASTCCRSPGTSTTARKAPARSTSGARSRGSSSRARSTAAGTSTGCVRARSTCRASSGSAAPRRSAGPRWPRSRRGSAALRDRLLDGLRARARRRSRQRLARAPPAAQPARQLRQGRRRVAADGARRPRGVDRIRVQFRQPGAVARARRPSAPSATAPARRSGSASAARRPTPTSTSRSSA